MFRLTAQRDVHVRVLGAEFGEILIFETGENFLAGGRGLVHLGLDIDDAVEVGAADGGQAGAELRLGDDRERNGGVVLAADAHFAQGVEFPAFFDRIADHHLDFVATALDALGFAAVEGIAHVHGDIAAVETGGLAGGC